MLKKYFNRENWHLEFEVSFWNPYLKDDILKLCLGTYPIRADVLRIKVIKLIFILSNYCNNNKLQVLSKFLFYLYIRVEKKIPVILS